MVERVKDVCEKYETLKEECQKLKEKCEKYETLVKDEETSVTQSLSRAMRPCDDIVGLIGEAVVRIRGGREGPLEYWRNLYTGSEHHWQQGKRKQCGEPGPPREKDTLIGIRKGQSWCTSAPFDEKERRRYEEAREDPEVMGEALFELEKRCEERREWFRVQEQLVKEHRYKWRKPGKLIKWMRTCNSSNPGWDLEYIRWRGAGHDFYDPYMWTESSSTHRMKREAVRLRQLRPAWDRWVRAAAR